MTTCCVVVPPSVVQYLLLFPKQLFEEYRVASVCKAVSLSGFVVLSYDTIYDIYDTIDTTGAYGINGLL